MKRILLALLMLSITLPAFAAHHKPGEGVKVRPARATWNTGYFSEALVSAGLQELGYEVDDASVNFRGIMVRKGTPQPVIDKLATVVPEMFKDASVAKQMKNGGSPVRIMSREEVQQMWEKRQVVLTELLKGL